MSAISGPLLQWLEDRLEQNKQRVQELQQEKEQLLEELAALEWKRKRRPFRKETWEKLCKTYSWLKGGLTLPYSEDASNASCPRQQRALLQDKGLSAPPWLMASSGISPGDAWCSAVTAQWWGWAAPEETSVLEGTHLGSMLFLPPLYFDRSLIALHVFREPRTRGLDRNSVSLQAYLMLPTSAFF